jgi:lipopolysaccharide export LptBFGC system permease protein LptF
MKLSKRQRRTARKLFLPFVALVMMVTAMAAASASASSETVVTGHAP